MKKMLSIAALAALATSSFAASDLASAFKEGTVSGDLRALYMNNSVSSDAKAAGTPNNSAFAVGGKLKYETAPLYGLTAGVGFYTVQDLGTANPTAAKNVAGVFDSDNKSSYSLLGEAYLQYAVAKTVVKVGRQTLDTPLAGSDDIRMIPNLFEAALVINSDLPQTTLIGGYVSRMAGLDSYSNTDTVKAVTGSTTASGVGSTPNGRISFQSMSRSALGNLADLDNSKVGGTIGDSVGDKGVYVVAAVNSSIKDLTLQVWEYYAQDVVNAVYGQADYKLGLGGANALDISVQGYNMQGIGKTKDLLNSATVKGLGLGKIDYSVYGAKLAYENALGLTPYVAYDKVTEQKDGTNGGTFVFGAWGGYPEFAIGEETFYNTFGNAAAASTALNGAQVWKVGADYDLSKLGLGARTFGVAYTKFDLKNQYNGGTDTDTGVWDVKYTCKGALVKNLDATLLYENADSKNNIYDRNTYKVVLNYNF